MPQAPGSWKDRAYAAALVVLAVVLALDQVAWNHADGQPLAREDSALHALASMQAADMHRHAGAPLGMHVFWQPGYYPPFTYWLSIWVHGLFGLEPARYRDTLALFAGALVLGVGLLAARLWGRPAGLAAAGLALCSPVLYLQRPESMLDAPLAGALALALAALPRPTARLPAALGAGVLAGLMVLTKQSGLFFAAPMALGLLSGGARAPERRRALGVALAWGVGAALTCGPWLVRSAHFFSKVLANVDEQHNLPTGAEGLVWRLSWLVYLKDAVLAPPLLLLLVPGGVLALWRRPAGLGTLALVALGGFVGLSSFPDAHERHFAPFAPLLLAVAAAPVALLRGRWAWAVGGLLAATGLFATLSWRVPALGEGLRVELSRDARLRRTLPTVQPGVLVQELGYRPPRAALLAPRPRGWDWPTRELVQEVLDRGGVCNDPRMDVGPVLLTMEGRLSADLLKTEALALGCHVLRAWHVEPQQLDRLLVERSRDLGAGVWAVTAENADARHAQALLGAGFSEQARYPALESGDVRTELVLWGR